MKKGIRKIISVIGILTMIFQMIMPIIPGINSKVFATENTNTTETTEEISRNYEIKEEETWYVSANGDGSVIAKWSLDGRTLIISGTGEMKNWKSNSEEDWHNTQYTGLIQKVIIEKGVTNIGNRAISKVTIIYTELNSEGHRYAEKSKQGYILIYEKGDINGNGIVDVTDLFMLKKVIVENI